MAGSQGASFRVHTRPATLAHPRADPGTLFYLELDTPGTGKIRRVSR